MQVSKDTFRDFTLIALQGEVDLASSPQARKAIMDALSRGPLLVDLSGVEYIDSSGIASLVEGFQLANDKGLRFGLVGVSEVAMRVIQLARLDKVFPVYTRLEEID